MVAKRPKRLRALSGKECRVECLRLIPFVENDQVELELVVDTREHTHLGVKLDKNLFLTYLVSDKSLRTPVEPWASCGELDITRSSC